jgi:katanin p60 ATPase-containing subunit A1
MSALSTMRVNTMAKDVEAARAKASTRDAVVLLHRHLEDNGYGESADALAREAASALAGTTVADDVSLERIFREHEEHHVATHGAPPKLYAREAKLSGRDGRARDDDPEKTKTDLLGAPKPSATRSTRAARDGETNTSGRTRTNAPSGGGATGALVTARAREKRGSAPKQAPDAALGVVGVGAADAAKNTSSTPPAASAAFLARSDRAPSDAFSDLDFGSEDLNALARVIARDVYVGSPDVRWGDVAGLAGAKKILREAVVAPFRYPALFTGLLRPWRGVLLHGPPGTGKTMLAKAVASASSGPSQDQGERGSVFFNVSASTVVSKFRGDSEKLVRVLFSLARARAPSVVFMDEIDALMCERGGSGGGEHEASRRMKTELLIQLDGLDAREGGGDVSAGGGVFLLAATNTPWSLDPALLRRMEKRVFVGLPDLEARRAMLHTLLGGRKRAPEVCLDDVARETAGYSGSDVAVLCKETAMAPLRRLVAALDAAHPADALSERVPVDASAIGPITAEDVRGALATTKPSAANQLERHERWSAQFGQTG